MLHLPTSHDLLAIPPPCHNRRKLLHRQFGEEENADSVRTNHLNDQTPVVGVFCASSKTVDPPPLDPSRSLSKLKIHEIQGLAGDFLSTTECLNYQPVFVVDGRRTEKITKEGDPFPTSRRGNGSFEKASHAGEFCEGDRSSTVKKAAATAAVLRKS